MHSSTHKSEFQAPREVFSTYYPHSLLCSISPNALFPFPSSLSVSFFLNFFLLIRSSSSLHLSEYLHLSHLISFIFFLAHISFSFPVLLSPLSSHHIFPYCSQILCFLFHCFRSFPHTFCLHAVGCVLVTPWLWSFFCVFGLFGFYLWV